MPQTVGRGVQGSCAVVQLRVASALLALPAGTSEKPSLLSCSLTEEKIGSFTSVGTCRVFV